MFIVSKVKTIRAFTTESNLFPYSLKYVKCWDIAKIAVESKDQSDSKMKVVKM